jgi:hypothetical protein
MVRQQRLRRSAGAGPDVPETEPRLDRLPRRPVVDTRSTSRLLDRIRRVLLESRSPR